MRGSEDVSLPSVILRACSDDFYITTARDMTAPGGKARPLFVQDTAEMKSPPIRPRPIEDGPLSSSPSHLPQVSAAEAPESISRPTPPPS